MCSSKPQDRAVCCVRRDDDQYRQHRKLIFSSLLPPLFSSQAQIDTTLIFSFTNFSVYALNDYNFLLNHESITHWTRTTHIYKVELLQEESIDLLIFLALVVTHWGIDICHECRHLKLQKSPSFAYNPYPKKHFAQSDSTETARQNTQSDRQMPKRS